MIPFLILGAIGVVSFTVLASKANAATLTPAQLAARSSSTTPGTLPPNPNPPNFTSLGGPNSSAMIGLGAAGLTGGLQAAAGVGMMSAKTASTAIPIVGTIAAVGLGIYGIFAAHHQAALKAEGGTLNYADPLFAARLQAIVGAYNTGELDKATALSFVDQAVAEYDTNVAKITNNPGATSDSSNCNAACYVRIHYTLPAAQAAKAVINSGGQVDIQAIPAHATQSGLGGYRLAVTRQ